MRRRILAVLASSVLVSIGLASSAYASQSPSPEGGAVVSAGPLRDLRPDKSDPTDGAMAALVATSHGDSSRHRLVLWNLDPSSGGQTFGVHIHVGPCVPGDGDAAGDHYNAGGDPSPQTEVWLDSTVKPGGFALSRTSTPFAIPAGDAQSLVVHEAPTDETGDAGDRLACIPAPY